MASSVGIDRAVGAAFEIADAASARFSASLSAVPEPANWAMLVLGFGMLGAVLRQRTQVRVRFA